jgi:hypothetical protein
MKTWKKISVLKHDRNGHPIKAKEHNLVMDNCGGQNKNNCVLLLAPYLVEMGYFDRVNMLFLVVGHTRNVCDRWFNNLKKFYHNSQVFSLDDTVECLSKNKYVTVWKVKCTRRLERLLPYATESLQYPVKMWLED